MWHRLRNDFQLAIITLFGVCATLGITPFAIYRFVSGNQVAGFIDSAIVLSIVAAMVHAWRSETTRVAAWFIVVVTTLGCMAIAMLLGLPGLFWMYAVVLATFLLLRSREAALVTATALAVLAIQGGAFASTLQLAMFAATLSMVALFAFIFAYRSEQQRYQLQALARRDPLTGMVNRRSMEEELQLAIDMTRRERRPCGLAILDLDHFKRVNDRDGHAAGDQVLIDFAQIVTAGTRKVDRLFRYGGEEFVLLLPGADAAALGLVVESLRRRIGNMLRSNGQPITVSIGAAALQSDEDWEQWLARADAALYQAKDGGRNCSVIAEGGIQGEVDSQAEDVDCAQVSASPAGLAEN